MTTRFSFIRRMHHHHHYHERWHKTQSTRQPTRTTNPILSISIFAANTSNVTNCVQLAVAARIQHLFALTRNSHSLWFVKRNGIFFAFISFTIREAVSLWNHRRTYNVYFARRSSRLGARAQLNNALVVYEPARSERVISFLMEMFLGWVTWAVWCDGERLTYLVYLREWARARART